MGNQFAFTEYNCGLLQNVIQQPPFCLFTDLLLLEGYHLIAYCTNSSANQNAPLVIAY